MNILHLTRTIVAIVPSKKYGSVLSGNFPLLCKRLSVSYTISETPRCLSVDRKQRILYTVNNPEWRISPVDGTSLAAISHWVCWWIILFIWLLKIYDAIVRLRILFDQLSYEWWIDGYESMILWMDAIFTCKPLFLMAKVYCDDSIWPEVLETFSGWCDVLWGDAAVEFRSEGEIFNGGTVFSTYLRSCGILTIQDTNSFDLKSILPIWFRDWLMITLISLLILKSQRRHGWLWRSFGDLKFSWDLCTSEWKIGWKRLLSMHFVC